MSEEQKAKLKEEAKRYVRSLYLTHRNDDIDAWDRIIDVVWLYIDEQIRQHCEDTHENTN